MKCLTKKLLANALIVQAIQKRLVEEENVREQQIRRQHRMWTRKWILRRNRELQGTIHLAHIELRIEDTQYFQRFFRMRGDLFDRLVKLVTPYIQRQNTNMRECISPKERLSLTLRFLATGESYRSLEYSTRIPACTISRIIPETCRVIYEVLRNEYLQVNKNLQLIKICNHLFPMLIIE